MVKEVVFMSKKNAELEPSRANWAVISIYDYFQEPPVLQAGWHDILRLQFLDEDMGIPGLEAFTPEQAALVVDFINRMAPQVEGILVHCHKGVSRSAAVAKYISQRYQLVLPEGTERYNTKVFQKLQACANSEAV